MSVIAKKLSLVVLFLIEAVLWVFVLKIVEKGWNQMKGLNLRQRLRPMKA